MAVSAVGVEVDGVEVAVSVVCSTTITSRVASPVLPAWSVALYVMVYAA